MTVRRLAAIVMVCAFALVVCTSSVALANSARMHWEGVSSPGAMAIDEDCPVVVEGEKLVFDVVDFPEAYYGIDGDPASYASTVTAAYEFLNPADYAVSMTLAFPFGVLPDYLMDAYYETTKVELDRLLEGGVGVWVDGKQVELTLRHTYFSPYRYFDVTQDLSLLESGYVHDSFYAPDLPVTKYTYRISGVAEDDYAATIGFRWTPRDDAKIMLINQSGLQRCEDNQDDVIVNTWAESGGLVEVYVFGSAPDDLAAVLYEDGSCETTLDATAELVDVSNLAFADIAFMSWSDETSVLKHDWYNAMVAYMRHCESEAEGIVMDTMYQGVGENFDLSGMLLRWYQYDLDFEAGQRLSNSVIAPLYPSINLEMEPPVYGYEYLLSPAQLWSDFKSLHIVINTPYCLVESNLEGFKPLDCEEGYALSLEGLPQSELEFVLSTSENPKEPFLGSDAGYVFALFAPLVGLLLLGVLVVVLFMRIFTKKSCG